MTNQEKCEKCQLQIEECKQKNENRRAYQANSTAIIKDYGIAGIKYIVMINGVAAISVLSKVQPQNAASTVLVGSLLYFCGGAFIGVSIYLFGYLAQSLQSFDDENDNKWSTFFRCFAIFLSVISGAFFLIGCYTVYSGFATPT